MKRSLLFLIASFVLFACKEEHPDSVPVSSITISQPAAEMIVGEIVQLKATILPNNATDKTIYWASSKQSVATISENGLLTAIAEGQSTITATAGGKTASCHVSVSNIIIKVSSISLNKTELYLVEGDEETLTVTVKPNNASDKTVEWSSSAPKIADVKDGKVTAIEEGEATITAKAEDIIATCKVVVEKKAVPVESIELNKTSLSLVEGESDILVATVKPDNATDKTVSWVTSDASVVSVEDDGKIMAIKEGKATVAAKSGEKTATCEVTVSKKVIAVESIILDKTSIVMLENESALITATVKPNNATDKTVIWSSSDESVATVNDGHVKSIKEGKAIITAKAGGKTAGCEVTVKKRTIDVSSIELSHATLSLSKGDSFSLKATVKPDDATDKTVTWTTSDASVATVYNNGVVIAKKEGTATITAKAGGKIATCTVTVLPPDNTEKIDDDGQYHDWD